MRDMRLGLAVPTHDTRRLLPRSPSGAQKAADEGRITAPTPAAATAALRNRLACSSWPRMAAWRLSIQRHTPIAVHVASIEFDSVRTRQNALKHEDSWQTSVHLQWRKWRLSSDMRANMEHEGCQAAHRHPWL